MEEEVGRKRQRDWGRVGGGEDAGMGGEVPIIIITIIIIIITINSSSPRALVADIHRGRLPRAARLTRFPGKHLEKYVCCS